MNILSFDAIQYWTNLQSRDGLNSLLNCEKCVIDVLPESNILKYLYHEALLLHNQLTFSF